MYRRLPMLIAMLVLCAFPCSGEAVDEPLGARYSLGMTLWHMGHRAEMIRGFHEFLEQRGVAFSDLHEGPVPDTVCSVLVEPQRLPEEDLSGWVPGDGFLTSAATDAGPTVAFPLVIPREGTYRLWVSFYGWPTGTGVTSLRLYPKGEEHLQPLVSDEIYDYAVEEEGLHWKDLIVHLQAGEYTARLGHVTRWWHAGRGPAGYHRRLIRCLYLTDALWREAPEETTLDAMREARPPDGIQWTITSPPEAGEMGLRTRWAVRPVSWKQREEAPALFALSREYWREQVARLAGMDYDEAALPDYREDVRQVIFDDAWNMVANPVRIRRQVEALMGDIRRVPTEHEYHWMNAGEFDEVTGAWERRGGTLWATYSDFSGEARHALRVGQAGDYQVWVRFRNINYHAPWRVTATAPDGAEVQFDRDQQLYPRDGTFQAAWQKVGVLALPDRGTLQLRIVPLGFRQPGTYRGVYSVLVTTDPEHAPEGSVKPAITPEQYLDRVEGLGADLSDGYLLWTPPDAYTPLSQESWPNDLDQGKQQTLPADPNIRLSMASDTVRAAPVYLRNLGQAPRVLRVTCGPLEGPAGRFEGRVSWQVIAFAPYGSHRQEWSPFMLMRRPDVTVPPWSVAGIWLSVDNLGMTPGRYESTVTLHGDGLPDREVRLEVTVSGVRAAPDTPVLVGGWTAPPEGEEYMADYQAHGMNIFYRPMSSAEMERWGIRLLALPTWQTDADRIRETIDRLKAGGLDYDDWIFTIKDEPTGKTEEELRDYLDVARVIREVDPQARISFNPGEAATLATFEVLDPLCDFWLPYTHHRHYHPSEAEAKRAIFTRKPWMWYTTPCLWDKSPALPRQHYGQVRSVPGQPGHCVGTAFFAFYYPFRDPWDTAYEHIRDAAVTVLPSRHGPVPTRAWEALREGIQHANLALMVRERLGAATFEDLEDEAVRRLVAQGSVDELIRWLEENP